MTPEDEQIHYAETQHSACCKFLGISDKFDAQDDTLMESICTLKKELAVWKHDAGVVREELEATRQEAIDLFIAYHECKESLRNTLQWIDDGNDQEGRDLIVGPLRAKHFKTK